MKYNQIAEYVTATGCFRNIFTRNI